MSLISTVFFHLLKNRPEATCLIHCTLGEVGIELKDSQTSANGNQEGVTLRAHMSTGRDGCLCLVSGWGVGLVNFGGLPSRYFLAKLPEVMRAGWAISHGSSAVQPSARLPSPFCLVTALRKAVDL